jgi:hypothetical protein
MSIPDYATPIEKAQFELLGRIADALEGIRFALVSKIVPVQPLPAGTWVETVKNPYTQVQTTGPQPETTVRQVMTQSENQINGWKPYEESKNKE